MISKTIKLFCREDISLIENYEAALNDKTQVWECHHRRETDEGLSARQLIEMGLYINRPADELILLTKSAHQSLHKHNLTDEVRKNISEAHKGKPLSEKNIEKLSKKVLQIDKHTGIAIREWKSIREVERTLGIRRGAICGCCKGRLKSAGGFVWRYAE